MPRDAEQIYDEWLVSRIRCNDRAALEELLTRWHARWVAYALHRVGRDDIARDVVQDAMICMCRTIRRLQDGAAFRAWAYRIVARRAADALRRRTRLRRFESPASSPVAPAAPPDSESATLIRAVDGLDEDHREVIRLHYGSDLSIDEIAHVLSIPPGTVKSRLHAARARVRSLIEFPTCEGDTP